MNSVQKTLGLSLLSALTLVGTGLSAQAAVRRPAPQAQGAEAQIERLEQQIRLMKKTLAELQAQKSRQSKAEAPKAEPQRRLRAPDSEEWEAIQKRMQAEVQKRQAEVQKRVQAEVSKKQAEAARERAEEMREKALAARRQAQAGGRVVGPQVTQTGPGMQGRRIMLGQPGMQGRRAQLGRMLRQRLHARQQQHWNYCPHCGHALHGEGGPAQGNARRGAAVTGFGFGSGGAAGTRTTQVRRMHTTQPLRTKVSAPYQMRMQVGPDGMRVINPPHRVELKEGQAGQPQRLRLRELPEGQSRGLFRLPGGDTLELRGLPTQKRMEKDDDEDEDEEAEEVEVRRRIRQPVKAPQAARRGKVASI